MRYQERIENLPRGLVVEKLHEAVRHGQIVLDTGETRYIVYEDMKLIAKKGFFWSRNFEYAVNTVMKKSWDVKYTL